LLLSAGTRSTAPDAIEQTRCTAVLLSIDGTDMRTDGRTDTRPLRRACSAYYAGNVNKKKTAAGQDYLSIRGICVARLKC